MQRLQGGPTRGFEASGLGGRNAEEKDQEDDENLSQVGTTHKEIPFGLRTTGGLPGRLGRHPAIECQDFANKPGSYDHFGFQEEAMT
jgi:hypothetical protein